MLTLGGWGGHTPRSFPSSPPPTHTHRFFRARCSVTRMFRRQSFPFQPKRSHLYPYLPVRAPPRAHGGRWPKWRLEAIALGKGLVRRRGQGCPPWTTWDGMGRDQGQDADTEGSLHSQWGGSQVDRFTSRLPPAQPSLHPPAPRPPPHGQALPNTHTSIRTRPPANAFRQPHSRGFEKEGRPPGKSTGRQGTGVWVVRCLRVHCYCCPYNNAE